MSRSERWPWPIWHWAATIWTRYWSESETNQLKFAQLSSESWLGKGSNYRTWTHAIDCTSFTTATEIRRQPSSRTPSDTSPSSSKWKGNLISQILSNFSDREYSWCIPTCTPCLTVWFAVLCRSCPSTISATSSSSSHKNWNSWAEATAAG